MRHEETDHAQVNRFGKAAGARKQVEVGGTPIWRRDTPGAECALTRGCTSCPSGETFEVCQHGSVSVNAPRPTVTMDFVVPLVCFIRVVLAANAAAAGIPKKREAQPKGALERERVRPWLRREGLHGGGGGGG